MKEPNMFHNYETEKITRKASDAGRQNPTQSKMVVFSKMPSKMARAGQRVDTSFSSHYYSFAKSG